MVKLRLWSKDVERYFPQDLVNDLTLVKINSGLFKVELFTGQFDKNGIEIYSGDIVKFMNKISVVCWDSRLSSWIILRDNNPYNFDSRYGEMLEVMGNINQNKELLNVGN